MNLLCQGAGGLWTGLGWGVTCSCSPGVHVDDIEEAVFPKLGDCHHLEASVSHIPIQPAASDWASVVGSHRSSHCQNQNCGES